MHLKITTKVEASLTQVKNGFTESLFLALNPPFPPVRLLEFGGCREGDRVALRLNFIFFKQDWISLITEEEEQQDEWFFVDKGVKLPFFLKSWKHKHIVKADKNGSVIIDDIRFSTGTLLTDLLMYPALLGQFAYRKPIYKKFFKT